MIIKIVCPTAMEAFLLPRRAAIRRYWAERYVFLVCDAASADSTRSLRNQGLPLRVLPFKRFPALSWFPGHIPAQEAKCLALGNRVVSVPISANTPSAAR